MYGNGPRGRAEDERMAMSGQGQRLPELNVSAAASEHREDQRENQDRKHQQQSPSLRGQTTPTHLLSPLSATFSGRPERPTAVSTTLPPPPYMPSEPPSPAYSHTSFGGAAAATQQQQNLLSGEEKIRTPDSSYFSPYSAGAAAVDPEHSAYPGGDGTGWVPMQRPLPTPLGGGAVGDASFRRRRRLRLLSFCCLPVLLLLVAAIMFVVFGVVRTRAGATS